MATFSDVDPATGVAIAEIEITSRAQLAATVAAARRAQEAWSNLAFAERRALLLEGGRRLDRRPGGVLRRDRPRPGAGDPARQGQRDARRARSAGRRGRHHALELPRGHAARALPAGLGHGQRLRPEAERARAAHGRAAAR